MNDKLDAHEPIRNKLLNNIGVSNDIKNRVGDNPSIALTRKQHLEVHRQEIKLRKKLGLGRNQMHDSFSVELDIAAQSLRNAGIPNGKIKRLLEHAKRFWGRLAMKNKCSG